MTAFYAFAGIVIGMFAVVAWWFAMFSDSDWGEAAREMLDGGFNLGRNTIAVIEPAVGGLMLFGSCGVMVVCRPAVVRSWWAWVRAVGRSVVGVGLSGVLVSCRRRRSMVRSGVRGVSRTGGVFLPVSR